MTKVMVKVTSSDVGQPSEPMQRDRNGLCCQVNLGSDPEAASYCRVTLGQFFNLAGPQFAH